MMTPLTYFAHPVSDYGTPFEASALDWLAWQGYSIENPNQRANQLGYLAYGMDWFMTSVLPGCTDCIFLRLPGGWLSSGVAMEVDYFFGKDKDISELFVDSAGEFQLSGFTFTTADRRFNRDETRGATRVLQSFPNGGR